jgi:hypothetical protein
VELKQPTTEMAANDPSEYSPAASQRLRYYIHDHSHAFRLQLVGSFSEIDVPELDGCWSTASRSVADRKICIDLREVTDIDDVARGWLSKMSYTEAVEFLASPDLAPVLPEGSAVTVSPVEVGWSGGWQTLMRFFARERRPSISYEMAIADPPVTLRMGRRETQIPAA